MQKGVVDGYADKRNKSLSFGPLFKAERTYFPIGVGSLPILPVPKEFLEILDTAGYYCPDFRKKYVYEKNDKLKEKPVRLMTIIEKSVKFDKSKLFNLKQKFDNRLLTSRKEFVKTLICITHNPYDVAGMSTDRNWTSCMNLDTGTFRDTPLKQVQYGRNVCIFN